jgi:hypothetical protein
MGWVGFWGHDKYDVPNQMGFEFRFLTGSDNNHEMRRWLSDFPRQIQSRDFNLEPTQLERWMVSAFHADLRKKHETTFMGPLRSILQNLMASQSLPDWGYNAMSPHQDVGVMLEALPFSSKKYLLGMNSHKVLNDFKTRGRLRYIIHDWSMDPLLFDASEVQLKKLEDAQLRAIRKYAQGKKEAEVIQEFLIESDLYFLFAKSVNFNP